MGLFDGIVGKFMPRKILNIEAGAYTTIKVSGVEVVKFKIDGFADEDQDGNPEFKVYLDVPFSALDIDETIEIPLQMVSGGIFGVIGKVLNLSSNFGLIGKDKKASFIKTMDNYRALIESNER